jgi:hypothetical protein
VRTPMKTVIIGGLTALRSPTEAAGIRGNPHSTAS